MEINDKRLSKEFKSITFSNYKKSDAKKELLNNLANSNIEASCYWTGEFICAGHFIELWDIIFLFICKNIHLGNPKLPIYIEMRFKTFKQILSNGYIDNELALRNNEKIRQLFAELICVICLSEKKNSLDEIKVNKQDFNTIHLTSKLKAKNTLYVQPVFRKKDPTELFIALNELSYAISIKNTLNAWYWIEWILEYEKICISKKKKCIAERRENIPVASIHQMDIIWIIWDIILHQSIKKKCKITSRILKCLLNLFCIQYKPSVKKRRRNILYMAISLLTESYDLNIKIFKDTNMIENVKKKINLIYKEIKTNEISPKTDYLFNNSFTTKTVQQNMNKIKNMNILSNFTPRS